MKEFVDKLIEKLGEYRNFKDHDNLDRQCIDGTIQIAKKLAKDHKSKVMIDEEYCWQTCSSTEYCKECNRLSNGSIDYYENYDFMVEKHNNDFCEWEIGDYGDSWKPCCCNDYKYYLRGVRKFVFCPYCGKKIKVVE